MSDIQPHIHIFVQGKHLRHPHFEIMIFTVIYIHKAHKINMNTFGYTHENCTTIYTATTHALNTLVTKCIFAIKFSNAP